MRLFLYNFFFNLFPYFFIMFFSLYYFLLNTFIILIEKSVKIIFPFPIPWRQCSNDDGLVLTKKNRTSLVNFYLIAHTEYRRPVNAHHHI